jgi:hypothetical protein
MRERPRRTSLSLNLNNKGSRPNSLCVCAQVTWFREGIQIPNSQDFQIRQDGDRSILFIREVQPEDSGIFTCRLTNAAGVAECSAELFVEGEWSGRAMGTLCSGGKGMSRLGLMFGLGREGGEVAMGCDIPGEN